MIHRETPNFKASLYAPNPKEVTYWIDLKEGPDGQIIKTFNGVEWVMINDALNDKQNEEIENLKNRCTNFEETKVDKTEFNEFVEEAEQIHNQLDQDKADKATTLAGYGITDAYTKNETDSRINTAVANLVNQAPETLDTLDELAQALGDDANFATTVATQLGQKVNTSDYNADKATFATKTEVNAKQDTLVSGTNIKTVNSQSLLGSGDIAITVPTNVSDLTNDSGYITNSALANYATTDQLNTKVSGTGVTSIQVVSALPGTQESGVLYIVPGESGAQVYITSNA